MKDFGKQVLATMVGIILFFVLTGVMMLMSIVGMVASGEAKKTVEDNSVLVINLSGTIDDKVVDNPFASLLGDAGAAVSTNDVVTAINKAAKNEDVKGIYIECSGASAGMATRKEIREALEKFKQTKKFIVAYAEQYSQSDYYLASVADKMYMNPSGSVDLHGMGGQMMYVKDMFAKFGIHYQVIKVGKYKSATEMYTEDHMSEANREQMERYVNGTWNDVLASISKSRKISVDSLNAYADRLTMMMDPVEIKNMKLVDGLLYNDEVKGEVKKLLKLDEDEAVTQISVSDMLSVKDDANGDEIAIYYAVGGIVDNAVQGFAQGDENQIVGSEVCKDLEALMNDDDVKAVVMRVNSPGGSAYASEQIWNAVMKLKAKKPVVVSMGDYAASGGYYISCAANWIVAQPNTLTGSIGIFGVIPECSDLLNNKLGLKFDEVKTNRNSTFGQGLFFGLNRPFTAEERDIMQQYINRGYSLFRKRVADGRKQPVEAIEAIAQGHVWLGMDAIGIKLVDELGGLDKAVAKAAKLAKLDEYYTQDYPASADWTEQLLSAANNAGGNNLDERMKVLLGEWYLPFMSMKAATEQSQVRAEIPFYFSVK